MIGGGLPYLNYSYQPCVVLMALPSRTARPLESYPRTRATALEASHEVFIPEKLQFGQRYGRIVL
jgi:hypothetical protein